MSVRGEHDAACDVLSAPQEHHMEGPYVIVVQLLKVRGKGCPIFSVYSGPDIDRPGA